MAAAAVKTHFSMTAVLAAVAAAAVARRALVAKAWAHVEAFAGGGEAAPSLREFHPRASHSRLRGGSLVVKARRRGAGGGGAVPSLREFHPRVSTAACVVMGTNTLAIWPLSR